MRTPIRLRLSISHILVLLIGMILAGVLVWFAVEGIYLANQRENLLAQARLTAAAISGSAIPAYPAELYSQTTNVTPGIHTRLLDEGGAVVIGVPFPAGEDPVQVPPWEDPGFIPVEVLLQRMEIQSALAGEASTAVRRIPSLDDKRVLYAAAPVLGENGDVISLVYLATPLPSQGLPANLTYQLIAVVSAAGLLAGIAGIFLARRIAKPLENLDRAAAAVSAGDLDQQVPVDKGITELENLGQRFNEMTKSIRHSDQAKNTFIADVSHELRTPLTVIKGTVETLEDGAIDDLPNRGNLLNGMHKETNRLIRLVNDLLTLTRADASALKLDLQSLDLEKLVRSRSLLFEPLAASREIMIKITKSGTDDLSRLWVAGDQDRLAQVVDNLLDNAIRHSAEGSAILVNLDHQGETVLCSVVDQGEGITAEHLPFIFERFYRADPSRERSSGGSGLGLAISRSLVTAMGGDIWAESLVGQGTSIHFNLPAEKNCHPTA